LFDYELANETGKPSGIDIKEKKMTLPLIFSLNKSTNSEKRHIINIVKNHNTDMKKVAEVIEFVKQKGGITYAEQKMLEYQTRALKMLEDFQESSYKTSLAELVQFATRRKK
jgi:octaprenyl-diphosphate synthase